MSDHEHERLGEEHPRSDQIQLMMFIVLLGVWITDSFIIKLYTISQIPLIIRLSTSIAIAGVGVIFVQKSHKLVIEADEPKLVDWGVYSITRHPMYLGVMLFELGIVTTTLSTLSLIIWIVISIIYNQLAAYEENSLNDVLEDEYKQYQKRVKRWGII
jgi:protein-S-isoprenylcysteine O-methyltransferase Ste14